MQLEVMERERSRQRQTKDPESSFRWWDLRPLFAEVEELACASTEKGPFKLGNFRVVFGEDYWWWWALPTRPRLALTEDRSK